MKNVSLRLRVPMCRVIGVKEVRKVVADLAQ